MILVTGAGGWLGSELTKQLLESNNEVRALNNVSTEQLEELKKEYPEKLEVVIGDICDAKCMKKSMMGIDKVFHLAAKVHCVPTNKKEEEEFFKINVQATENIFKLCLENKVKRVIFFSTVSVYEQTQNIVTTTSTKKPNTIYGKSKLEAEELANKLHKKNGFPITIIEPVTVYGEGDVGNFKKLESLIKKGICIKFGKGLNKKTVIYYKDLIGMTIKISDDERLIGDTIICGTEVLTLNQINNILIKNADKKVFKILIPTFVTNTLIKICCFSKLKKIRRKITALTQNNEFNIKESRKYISKYKKFEEYQSGK